MYEVDFNGMIKFYVRELLGQAAYTHVTKKENTLFHIQEKKNVNQLLK